jgi:hypothetical protein
LKPLSARSHSISAGSRQLFREYQRRVSKHQVEEPIEGEGTCDEDTPNNFEQFTQRRKK